MCPKPEQDRPVSKYFLFSFWVTDSFKIDLRSFTTIPEGFSLPFFRDNKVVVQLVSAPKKSLNSYLNLLLLF